MFREVLPEIKVCLNEYFTRSGAVKFGSIAMGGSLSDINADYFFTDDKLLLFLTVDEGGSTSVYDIIKESIPEIVNSPNVFEVLVVLIGLNISTEGIVIARGVKIVSLQSAIAAVVGLPVGWKDAQVSVLKQTLEPLNIAGNYEVANLYAVTEGGKDIAQILLKNLFQSWGLQKVPLSYLRAEAGKGKSTLLAYTALSVLADSKAPLPLYIPLRNLQRGSGISWGGLAAQLGVFGPAAENLRLAVSTGLVTLVLDGLDEVAGRYDPSIVKNLLDIVSEEVCSGNSRVIISGRTTESFLLNKSKTLEIGIELPESDDEEFKKYVSIVLKSITPDWPIIAKRVTEPRLQAEELKNEVPTDRHIEQMLEWLQGVFDEVGKERSLFFVQSLACIARTFQLAGNKPLVIRSPESIYITPAYLYDVSILAGALACIREQDKIEDIAKDVFTPASQISLLTAFAIRGSAEDHLALQLPTPRELARTAFNVDAVNQSEEFTAVVRQVQKHALLFSSVSDTTREGDWKPLFLSEWVRAAFICRAWLNRKTLPIPSLLISQIVARSQRSRIAFQSLFPEVLTPERSSCLEELIVSIRREADTGSPEASSNFWMLMSGLDADRRDTILLTPERINEFTDLNEISFDSFAFGSEFSANMGFFNSAEFFNCTFVDCKFTTCDFTNAVFTDCVFEKAHFKYCDGPIFFYSCKFNNSIIENISVSHIPGLFFDECSFIDSNLIQNKPPLPSGGYGPIFEFKESTGVKPLHEVCSGEWLGFDTHRTNGYSTQNATLRPPAEQCLLTILKRFFPRRAGIGSQLQVRRYIRTSALGRGVLPQGSPSIVELTLFLEAEGFTDGGREAHLYAPWSSVVGASSESIVLRNELQAFVRNGEQGATTSKLIEKINHAARWPLAV